MTVIDTVTVASLNLHCGFGRHGEPFDVAAAICQLDAAIICVQESWRPLAHSQDVPAGELPGDAAPEPAGDAAPEPAGDAAPEPAGSAVADAAAKLGATVCRARMCERPGVSALGIESASGPGELGIELLTTLPVDRCRVIELGRAPGDNIPRVAQVAHLELPGGGTLRVISTHLSHLGTSPLQLLTLLALLRQEPAGPTIIVGDLNMPRILARHMPGYSAAVSGLTYPSDRPRMQLDHILVSRGTGYCDGAVLPPAGSDHLPIRARLRIG